MTYAVPPQDGALAASVYWINDLLLGSLAAGLCVIAVAVVGMMMLGGRLPLHTGIRVALGTFVLLGAPVIATGLAGAWHGSAAPPELASSPSVVEFAEPRPEPPPSSYDPYAGASLRRD